MVMLLLDKPQRKSYKFLASEKGKGWCSYAAKITQLLIQERETLSNFKITLFDKALFASRYEIELN